MWRQRRTEAWVGAKSQRKREEMETWMSFRPQSSSSSTPCLLSPVFPLLVPLLGWIPSRTCFLPRLPICLSRPSSSSSLRTYSSLLRSPHSLVTRRGWQMGWGSKAEDECLQQPLLNGILHAFPLFLSPIPDVGPDDH